MERFICVHGHFYQPPRENPWFEEIEQQDSAYPWHDWNQRISAECYAPNAASRNIDSQGRILSIVSNYERISFNFGPTLLTWMEQHDPETYEQVLTADRKSQQRFSGHGSAMAQAYNHMIMPLATKRDKITQISWGIRDFESRFKRCPEGMWLPEAAVDLETLLCMADQGIKYTVLAPRQAKRFRPFSSKDDWQDAANEKIDPTRSYRQDLPGGKSISIFFYDGPISRAVAFEKLLNNGELLVERLKGAFVGGREWPQLVNIATDGETFGHHHRHGDMALAWALHSIEKNKVARLTNYGEYLEKFPPQFEVDIAENTSWSCVHGIERWRDNCGCNSGRGQNWNQLWRKPFREALDWLRDTTHKMAESAAPDLITDLDKARDEYINLLLSRTPETRSDFFHTFACRPLGELDQSRVLKILEMERQAMLMYTSCGWFFDEISGLETVQCLTYAGRVVQLAEELFGEGFEVQFLDLLGAAKSNVPHHADGEHIYEKLVRPAMVGFSKVCAHYAINSLFQTGGVIERIFCYSLETQDYQQFEAGKARLAIGNVRITSDPTFESAALCFSVLHFGDHNFIVRVAPQQGERHYRVLQRRISRHFQRADLPETLRALNEMFPDPSYTVRSLFRDDRQRLLDRILESTLEGIEATFARLSENNWPLMRFLVDIGSPLPPVLRTVSEFVQHRHIRDCLDAPDGIDPERLRVLVEEAKNWRMTLDRAGIGHRFMAALERMMRRLLGDPSNIKLLSELEATIDLLKTLPLDTDLWRIQNLYYTVFRDVYPDYQERSAQGDPRCKDWVEVFLQLGRRLSIKVDEK